MPVVGDFTALIHGNSLSRWYEAGQYGNGAFVSFSFPTAPPDYLRFTDEELATFRPFTQAEIEMAREAIAAIAAATGLTFFEVAPGEGDINFMVFGQLALGGSAGIGMLPGTGGQWSDVFIQDGSMSANLLIHEIGHTLGLKHPFQGDITLDPSMDSSDYTMMSYNWTATGTSLGPLDIDALQYLYGDSTADGNQVASWSWNASTGTLTQQGDETPELLSGIGGAHNIIVAGGGSDLIFARGGSNAIDAGAGDDNILLSSPTFSVDGGEGYDVLNVYAVDFRSYVDSSFTLDELLQSGSSFQNIEMLYIFRDEGQAIYAFGSASTLFNATQEDDDLHGGDGNDTFLGWAGNDEMYGNGGNDEFRGSIWSEGDDLIDGGAGSDLIAAGLGNDFINGGSGQDQVAFWSDFSLSGITFYRSGSYLIAVSQTDGTDFIVNVETIILGDGQTYSVQEILESAPEWSGPPPPPPPPAEPPTTYTIAPGAPTIVEGNSGGRALVFTITLDQPAQQQVELAYGTVAGGSAQAGTDYWSTSGTLVILAGSSSAIVSVPVLGDTVYEPNETIRLQVSGSDLGATQYLTGTILNDDSPPPGPATLTLTAPGQDFTIGGDVLVYGTTAAGEVIELLHGDVRLDASFNIGGDTVVLPGNAGSYTAVLAGSFVTIEGGGLTVAIPVGIAGLNVQFADSTRELRFDTGAGQVMLGAQAVTSVEAPVAAIGAPLSDPAETGPSSLGRLVLAEAGQDIDIGGNVSIFGSTAPGEVITVLEGTIVLDASFNAGGDTVVLPGNAGSYTATLAGSFVTIAGGGISVAIPVGIAGLTVDFADADRVLRFDTSAGQVMLGTQAITSGGGAVTARVMEHQAFAKDALADHWGQSELRLELSDSFSFG